MQSRTSFFNKALFCKTLGRYWPLWGSASLAGVMLPLFLGLSLLGSYRYVLIRTDVQQGLYSVLCYAVPIVSLFYAVLVALAVWNYLYSARSVSLMHTLPVDRTTLFFTSVCSGLAMMLIPYALTGALVILICLFNGALPVLAVLQTILGVIGLSLFYFATATLCAMVTGHAAAMPCFYFIGHFFFWALYSMVSQFATNFIFGFRSGAMPEWLKFLSPTICLYDTLDYTCHYEPSGENGVHDLLTHVTVEGLGLIAVYALIGAALLALALSLYRLRHSESAGDVVAFGWLRPIFRYGVSLCAALTLGQVLYEILWQAPFQNGDDYRMVPMCLCMIAAGVIGYYVASMLLAKSLRVFHRSLPGTATVAAMVVLLCACVSLDVFGVASRIPETDKVETLTMYVSGEEISVSPDHPLYRQLVAINEAIIADEAYIRANGRIYDSGYVEDTNVVAIRFTYYLHDGGSIQRYYRHVPLTRERWDSRRDTYDYLLNRLLNDPETIRHRLGSGELAHMYLRLYSVDLNTELTLTDAAAAQRIWNALLQDAMEGKVVATDLIKGMPADEVGHLEVEFRQRLAGQDPSDRDYSYSYSYKYFALSPYHTHTLRALLENGLISAAEYEIIRNDVSTSKEADIDMMTSFPETDAAAIIGGADGPTSITVSAW